MSEPLREIPKIALIWDGKKPKEIADSMIYLEAVISQANKGVVLDCGYVNSPKSEMLGQLVKLNRYANHQNKVLALTNLSSRMQQMLELCQMDRHFILDQDPELARCKVEAAAKSRPTVNRVKKLQGFVNKLLSYFHL